MQATDGCVIVGGGYARHGGESEALVLRPLNFHTMRALGSNLAVPHLESHVDHQHHLVARLEGG